MKERLSCRFQKNCRVKIRLENCRKFSLIKIVRSDVLINSEKLAHVPKCSRNQKNYHPAQ